MANTFIEDKIPLEIKDLKAFRKNLKYYIDE